MSTKTSMGANMWTWDDDAANVLHDVRHKFQTITKVKGLKKTRHV